MPDQTMSWPIYLGLDESAREAKRAQVEAALLDCRLCGRQCAINRHRGPGPCRIADVAYVASYGPHHGEEDVLRGWRGSGTIFFSGCNLHCVYCQNADISQARVGEPVTPEELAAIMLELQRWGCHNINLVSPTHVAAPIALAILIAAEQGLKLPVVYNTGGYDAPQALALMDGLIDLYMPDMKYADDATGERFSAVRNYPSVNRAAVREMHRQVGDLEIDARGLARRGLLVRHLVLPGGLAGTARIAQFLADEVSRNTYINVMAQYHPAYRARECSADDAPLHRRITPEEYQAALDAVRAAGLWRLDRARAMDSASPEANL